MTSHDPLVSVIIPTRNRSSLLALAQRADIYAPIAEAVHAVVEGEMTAGDMLTALISKEAKHERD